MKSRRKDVAQLYIAYRNQRSVARKAKTRDIFLEIIETKSNEVTRENANMNADTPAGMMMKFSSETNKAVCRRLFVGRRSKKCRSARISAHTR